MSSAFINSLAAALAALQQHKRNHSQERKRKLRSPVKLSLKRT